MGKKETIRYTFNFSYGSTNFTSNYRRILELRHENPNTPIIIEFANKELIDEDKLSLLSKIKDVSWE